jgi:hypothetical protein
LLLAGHQRCIGEARINLSKKTLRASEQERPDIARARRLWRKRQAGFDPARLIFLDVIMDNLSPHKSDPTLALITAAGAQVLFLPAYSPDLNPIEKMWSKVKSLLRGAEARTPSDLITAIGQALANVTPKVALGWLTSCGYRFC